MEISKHSEYQEHHKLYGHKQDSPLEIDDGGNNVNHNPEQPVLQNVSCHQHIGHYAEYGNEAIRKRVSSRLRKGVGEIFVQVHYPVAASQGGQYTVCSKQYKTSCLHVADGLRVGLLCPPKIPAVDTHPKEVKLQKHICIKLIGIKQDGETTHIYQTQWPGDYFVFGSIPHRQQASERADGLQIAEVVAENVDEGLEQGGKEREEGQLAIIQ